MRWKICAIDIGLGTLDLILSEPFELEENYISFVLPSPTRLFERIIRESKENLYIEGDTIGGGPIKKALVDHISKGFKVWIKEEAAFTLRNSKEEVENMGIQIRDFPPPYESFKTITFCELDLQKIESLLNGFGKTLEDVDILAVGVQDHGLPLSLSQRESRFLRIKEMVEKMDLNALFFEGEKIPDHFLRMRSVYKSAKRLMSCPIIVMDTSFCAIFGCFSQIQRDSLVVNVGNAHTMFALINPERKILGVLEHHTRLLKEDSVLHLSKKFVEGEIGDEDIRKEGGHGLFLIEKRDFSKIDLIVTGPKRKTLFSEGDVKFASPFGNMMMTGPYGLIEASRLYLD